MKTILCMVMSLNGKIAGLDGTYSWASKEDWESFQARYKKAGCIIIGRNTYDTLKDKPTFPSKGCVCVVVTHDRSLQNQNPSIIVTHDSPRDVLGMLENKGFTEVLIGGGGEINSLFMKENLIDEVLIDIEPVILGHGIPLFADSDFKSKLHLLSTKKLNQHTLQLHYRVIR